MLRMSAGSWEKEFVAKANNSKSRLSRLIIDMFWVSCFGFLVRFWGLGFGFGFFSWICVLSFRSDW